MELLSGLYDVIGRPAVHDGIVFVPIIGDFDFAQPNRHLHKHADLSFLSRIMDDELFRNDSLWVRARLIKVFGIHHPSGYALTTLLNFQAVAIDFNAESPRIPVPFIVADTFNGYVDDYGYSPDAAIGFLPSVPDPVQARIADGFWSLLLSAPTELGIFSDYWYDEHCDSLCRISCDGCRFHYRFLGSKYHETLNERDEEDHGWWPFELPRKSRRPRARTKWASKRGR